MDHIVATASTVSFSNTAPQAHSSATLTNVVLGPRSDIHNIEVT